MLFDNENLCFLNELIHSHELITLMFVIVACVFVAPSCVVARLGCHIFVLRVNLPGFSRLPLGPMGIVHTKHCT